MGSDYGGAWSWGCGEFLAFGRRRAPGAVEISGRLVAGEPLGRWGVQVGGAGPRKVQARAGPVTRTVWRVLEICHGDQHLSEDNRPEDLPQGEDATDGPL